jgi:hypothetical protein
VLRNLNSVFLDLLLLGGASCHAAGQISGWTVNDQTHPLPVAVDIDQKMARLRHHAALSVLVTKTIPIVGVDKTPKAEA